MDPWSLGYILKSMAALIVILIGINFLLKKMGSMAQKGSRHMRIIERMPLGRSSSLCIAEIYGKYYLLSCTEQQNEILREFDSSEVEEVLAQPFTEEKKSEQKSSFGNSMLEVLKKEMRSRS